jgi:amidase
MRVIGRLRNGHAPRLRKDGQGGCIRGKSDAGNALAIIDTYPTATELVAALRARQVSSVELVDAAIARIEAQDGVINAVVVRDFDEARLAAKVADQALAAGDDGALLGLPMTVKESYDLKGFPTTWGLEACKDYRAPRDSAVVERLRKAGAIILGKTNVPVNLADWVSENPIYGRTVNPLNPERSPGGSSGGAAAALAAGYVALEMGSDIGGSIRIPAAYCGVYGHKPSYGLVPNRGHSPGGAFGAPAALAVCGPLARSAADLGLALDVTAGPDGEEVKAYRLDLPASRHQRVADFRVLILADHPRCRTDSRLKAHLDELGRRLEGEGAKVARTSERLPDLAAEFGVYMSILMTNMSRRGAGDPSRPPISAHEWMDVLDQQARVRRQWAALFETFDVVVTPTFPRAAIPFSTETDWRKRSLVIDGENTPYGDGLAWPSLPLLPNLPATAMPLGKDADGMPFGIQVIGPYLEDRTCIAFAGLAARYGI